MYNLLNIMILIIMIIINQYCGFSNILKWVKYHGILEIAKRTFKV